MSAYRTPSDLSSGLIGGYAPHPPQRIPPFRGDAYGLRPESALRRAQSGFGVEVAGAAGVAEKIRWSRRADLNRGPADYEGPDSPNDDE